MSELPVSWVETTLGDVTADSAQRVPAADEQFQYVDIASIDRATKQITSPQMLYGRDAPSRARKEIRAGDVVVSMTRPNLNAVALVPPELDRQIASTGFDVLRSINVEPRWLFYVVRAQSFIDRMSELVQGALYPAVRSKDVRGYVAPLAPLSEQKRIADKLDTVLARVDACRERLDHVPAILKRFRQAVLAAAYTGELTAEFRLAKRLTPVAETLAVVQRPSRPNRYSSRTDAVIEGDYALAVGNPGCVIPNEWQWVPLVDIARMESGHTPSRAHPEYWGGDVPWVGIADARDWHGKTIPCTYQHTNEAGLAHSAARLLPADTICLSRTASVGYVVRMGVSMATSQDFANWICTRAIEPDWLKFLLVAETEAIYRFGKGSTHTTVYFPELMAFHVALPPIEEQHEIVRRVEALFAYADRLEARYTIACAQVERLTPALLAKAFRGELVPQDPNDEPASVLLERIRASHAAAGEKPPRKVRTERKPMTTTLTTG